jgi:hypothetical protein
MSSHARRGDMSSSREVPEQYNHKILCWTSVVIWQLAKLSPEPVSWVTFHKADMSPFFLRLSQYSLIGQIRINVADTNIPMNRKSCSSEPVDEIINRKRVHKNICPVLLEQKILVALGNKLKGTAQRDFNSVFWHLWIGLGLNKDRFWF